VPKTPDILEMSKPKRAYAPSIVSTTPESYLKDPYPSDGRESGDHIDVRNLFPHSWLIRREKWRYVIKLSALEVRWGFIFSLAFVPRGVKLTQAFY
jgi:hypothetical protein